MADIDKQLSNEIEQAIAQLTRALALIKSKQVPENKGIAERISLFREKNLCLFCEKPLGKDKPQRGVHLRCYQLMKQRAYRNIASMSDFENEGRIAPQGKSGRRPLDIESIKREIIQKAGRKSNERK